MIGLIFIFWTSKISPDFLKKIIGLLIYWQNLQCQRSSKLLLPKHDFAFLLKISLLFVLLSCFTSKFTKYFLHYLLHYGGAYHLETGPLICYENQWTSFCEIGISVIKQLIVNVDKILTSFLYNKYFQQVLNKIWV